MNSREKAKEWLVPRHKTFENELRESSSIWFKTNGHNVHSKMGYCLDSHDNWEKNIILPEVVECIQSIRDELKSKNLPFPLHTYAHHGLSSQALVFNLVGPLITRNDLSPLIELLKAKGINCEIHHAAFEYEDKNVFNEDTGQPTSIDVVLSDLHNNPLVFIESKLAEKEFGGCSIFKKGDCSGKNPINDLDECYLHFIGRKYWELLNKYDFKEKIEKEQLCVLANYYQFFREILLSIDKKGYFVLLYDERSPVFEYKIGEKRKGLIPLLMNFIPIIHQEKIVLITIKELVEYIYKSGKHNDWISEFENKYGFR